ncbi:thermostable hemolysin [Photobacterium sp. J15]|uniref:thermostable hemolysin n=1 Tax=Photobacterium sp. J15 TaxID=265901 RepID=UPI0007E3CCE5|nr:thermostable hemolysin [Photobacterium sp. J15]
MTPAHNNNNITLKVIDKLHPLRHEVEQYVANRYEHAFHAHLNEFMPIFLAIYDPQNKLLSACGYRVASKEKLFLEQYLNQPANTLISKRYAEIISRDKLIEFGQLASFSPGMSPIHFMLMTNYLVERGFEWCIFTATDTLYAMMCKLKLNPSVLADANPNDIPNADSVWGSYYQHRPRICCGNILAAHKQLTERFARVSAQKRMMEQ